MKITIKKAIIITLLLLSIIMIGSVNATSNTNYTITNSDLNDNSNKSIQYTNLEKTNTNTNLKSEKPKTVTSNNKQNIVKESTELNTETNSSLKNTSIKIISRDNWKISSEGKTYKVKLLDENNKPVIQSKINFVITNPYNKDSYYNSFTDEKGIAILPLNLDEYGVYNIQSNFYGNSEYASSEPNNSNVILVEKTIIYTPKKYAYRDSNFIIKLISMTKKPLTDKKIKIIVNNINYSLTTDSNGFVSVKMPSNKKRVKIKCIFKGDDYYTKSKLSMKLPVYKKTVIKPLVFSVLKGKNYKVLLKGKDGKILRNKKIKFIINEETYFRKTNSKGIAYLKVNVKRGKYHINSKFDNDGTYGPCNGHSVLNVIDPSGQFKKGLNQKTKYSVKKYLHGGGYAKVTKSIKKVSKSITKKYSTKLEKVVAIFNYVVNKVEYSFYLNSKKGATKTLKTKRGNCCDQSSLMIALCRASKIPARYVHCKKCIFKSGLVVGHVWAQVYVGGKWYSADTTSYLNSIGHISDWNTKKHGRITVYKRLPF